jgi:hypothetical protein
MKILKAVLLLAVATWALPANATFVLFDDFQSYTTGNLNAAGSNAFGVWTVRDGSGALAGGSGLVQLQNDGGNQLLAFGWNAGVRGVFRDSPDIADGDSATYYFQVRSADATPDVSYGLSDVAAPTNAGYGDYEVQIALTDDGNAANGLFNLRGRNGAALDTLATGLLPSTWYDIWLVADNATDTYDVYFGTTGDPNVLGALVGSNLAFRNGTTSALTSFMGMPNLHGDAQAHLDNIFFNSEAVPEPASFSAACIGMLLLGVCRSRR